MNHSSSTAFTSPHYQRGVNLIEIMVSMVIGLFLVLGATTLYVRSKKSADVDDSIARVQETARYAMSVLEGDIRMTNYWGFTKDGNTISNGNPNNPAQYAATLIPTASASLCGTNYSVNVRTPVAATDNSYALTCGASPSAAAPSADTLTIRRANTTVAALNATTSSATSLQICANPSMSTIVYNGSPTDAFPCQEIHDVIVNAYYVDQGSDQSSTLPSLRRKVLTTGPAFTDQEVIPGVEDMQVQLGWSSTASSNAAVQFLQPGTNGTGQVVAVRVWLLVRAENQDFTFTDTRTYAYGDRDTANGTVSSLASAGAANKAYAPNDNYRRVLVSRTYFLRNAAS